MMVRPLQTKRHLLTTLFLVVGVSLLFLVSCGVPNPLTLTNSETVTNTADAQFCYTIEKITENKFEVNIKSYDPILTTTKNPFGIQNGPSIILLYSIVPKDSYITSNLISNFETKYSSKTFPTQISLESNSNSVIPKIKNDDSEYGLYLFRYKKSGENISYKQNPSFYFCSYNDISNMMQSQIYTSSFSLNKTNDTTSFKISISEVGSAKYNVGSSQDVVNNVELKRFDSDSLEFPINNSNDFEDYPTNISSNKKIVIFAALNITESNYSNICMSKLVEIASFDI